MDVVKYLRSRYILGIPGDKLREILSGYDDEYAASTKGAGVISVERINSNDRPMILACVANYYTNRHDGKKIVCGGSGYTHCQRITEELGLSHVSLGDCRQCHLACLNASNKGIVSRVR